MLPGGYISCGPNCRFISLFCSGHQDNFHYTRQGGSPIINGVDDAKYFEETRVAFSLLGK